MADPEQLEILRLGVSVWNEWRRIHIVSPDLFEANLHKVDLNDVNFKNADLRNADLSGANLNFAILDSVHFGGANLSGADLRSATLLGATFLGTELQGANISRAIIGSTYFADVDLSGVKGLLSVLHYFPSSIGVDTLYRSGGKIPVQFLRNCGIPESFIVQIPAIIASADPIQFYSCFVSYSSLDQRFTERLHADLQNKGVRCWFAPKDLRIGEKIHVGIDESIRIHDKLLLILSKHSVTSDWVEQEVEAALDRERKEKRTVLFPVRLDDTVMKVDTGWPALIKNTRNIGDFRKWRNPEAYQKAFDRLLRDLKAQEKTTSS